MNNIEERIKTLERHDRNDTIAVAVFCVLCYLFTIFLYVKSH
jgi:hypothetical protein